MLYSCTPILAVLTVKGLICGLSFNINIAVCADDLAQWTFISANDAKCLCCHSVCLSVSVRSQAVCMRTWDEALMCEMVVV